MTFKRTQQNIILQARKHCKKECCLKWLVLYNYKNNHPCYLFSNHGYVECLKRERPFVIKVLHVPLSRFFCCCLVLLVKCVAFGVLIYILKCLQINWSPLCNLVISNICTVHTYIHAYIMLECHYIFGNKTNRSQFHLFLFSTLISLHLITVNCSKICITFVFINRRIIFASMHLIRSIKCFLGIHTYMYNNNKTIDDILKNEHGRNFL